MLYFKLITLAALLAFLVGSWFYIYNLGYQDAQTDTLKASVEAYKKREEIDKNVENLDDYQLCLDLGGLSDSCEQLRGMDRTTNN